MNPALPILAVLSLGGLLLGRRGIGLACAVSGVAGMLLVAAPLNIPDGVVSPSATVGSIAPFAQSGIDPAAGNPLLRDVTFQIEPWLIFLRRELRAGRLPFWNPWQLGGSAFWANGQSAPLFPLHLLFVLLPLKLGLVLVPWLRIVLGGTGAYSLARALGVRRDAALVAAVVYPLSGMCVSYLLYPMGNALALVPWVLWAAERLIAGTLRWPGFALVVALQALGGHPESVLQTVLLVGIYVVCRLEWSRPVARVTILRLGMASVVAALSTAVAWLPVALLVRASSRWQSAAGPEPALAILVRQPFRLILPQLFGHPADGSWWGPFNYSATAVYAGIFGLVLACAGAWERRGDRRWRALMTVVAVSALAAYHAPGLREALALLPIVGHSLPHRLLFGVELGLALLAAAGTEAWLSGRGRGLVAGAGVVVVALAGTWLLFRAPWMEHGQTRTMALASLMALAMAGALLLSGRVPLAWRVRMLPVVVGAVALDLVAAHRAINPALSFSRLLPRTGALEFLAAHPDRMAGMGDSFRPNLAMAYAIADLRGDDPLRTRRYDDASAAVMHADAPGQIEDWHAPWLDSMAVRWVLAAPGTPSAGTDWRTAYQGSDAVVFERPTALPMVHWESNGSNVGLTVVRRTPGDWEIAWRDAVVDRLLVAELAEPGWRAIAGPGVGALGTSRDGLLALSIESSSGTAALRYRPPGIAVGLVLSLVGCAALAAGARNGA